MSSMEFVFSSDCSEKEPLLYQACGLEGIYLLSGYEIEDLDGEEHITI